MSINFEQISSYEERDRNPLSNTRTVLEELNARQHLLEERTIKCASIRPLYIKAKRPPPRYLYQYVCVCPKFKPKYECKHTGNIIIDRDVLTQEEHIVYLARPKPDLAAPRKMARYYVKKSMVANCTARVMRLARPDKKQVTDTLNNFNSIISRRHKRSLEKCLEKPPNIEYTSIKTALELIGEEKRLKRVARRKERLQCEKLRRKIERKQRRQIKKIVGLLFEEMKEFLLNDEFNYEQSPLGEVILEKIQDFTDKEFHMTSNLRDYQRTLAYNLAIWISKFLASLNINVADHMPPPDSQMTNNILAGPQQELTTHLPVQDYILDKSKNEPMSTPTTQSEKPDTQPEGPTTVRNCSEANLSALYSNILLTDDNNDAAYDLQNSTDDDTLLHSSSSSGDIYFTAHSMQPKK